jgi:hypothetical protein
VAASAGGLSDGDKTELPGAIAVTQKQTQAKSQTGLLLRTIAAMKEARAGKGKRFTTVENLMADLHADD